MLRHSRRKGNRVVGVDGAFGVGLSDIFLGFYTRVYRQTIDRSLVNRIDRNWSLPWLFGRNPASP